MVHVASEALHGPAARFADGVPVDATHAYSRCMSALRGQHLLDTLDDAGLVGWQGLVDGIHARFLTGDFATGLRLVEGIGAAADEADHHPDVSLTYPHVDVRLISHDVAAVTERDLRLASRIDAIALQLGVLADPAAPSTVEVALDTADFERIAPFWAALLTGDAQNVNGDEISDPRPAVPTLWFQSTEEHDTPRQRFHLDVWVPATVAEDRIAAAVAAGGTVVDADQAPSFTVLADVEGNRACVCTLAQR